MQFPISESGAYMDVKVTQGHQHSHGLVEHTQH